MNMEIELIRVTSAKDHQLPRLLELYRESFPPEERRDDALLMDMLESPLMHFMAILRKNELTGFILYWDFNDFGFVEHFAIFPHLRRESAGSRVLQQLRKTFPKLLLEVEIPYDSLSERRLKFYSRNGFHVLNIPYAQPPYRKGETHLPMFLLSNFPNWEENELKQAIELFHEKVYYSGY